jgi:thymidine phosphorylase
VVPARSDGFVARVDAELVGRASVMLGAGRDRLDAPIDLAAGILVKRKPGEPVKAGDTVLELHYNDEQRVGGALPLAESAIDITRAAPPALPLVLAWVHAGGETSYV